MKSTPDQDADYDGFSRDHGDCDDCDPELSPAAFEVVGNSVDEDCDGMALQQPAACDGDLDPESDEAEDAVRALGLCTFSNQLDLAWGVRNADWKLIDGDDELEDRRQVWLTDSFGAVTPREGEKLLVMSTGVARDVDEPDYTPECDTFTSLREGDTSYTHGVEPPGDYPLDSSQCPEGSLESKSSPAYNDVGLRVRIKVPTNARSLAFDSIFFTHEYPEYVCSSFNDFFVVFMNDDERNIVFDSRGDSVGVNTALLSVCRQSDLAKRKIPCEQGPELLAGTGFDRREATCGETQENADIGGASTGWLHTSVPLPHDEFVTLHFMLWDSGDPDLDSTVGIDNLHFETIELSKPSTGPITAAP